MHALNWRLKYVSANSIFCAFAMSVRFHCVTLNPGHTLRKISHQNQTSSEHRNRHRQTRMNNSRCSAAMYAEVKHPKNTRVDRVTGLCRRGVCPPKHVTDLSVMSTVMTDIKIRVLPSLIGRFFYWRRLDLFVAFHEVLIIRVTVDAHYCLNLILNVYTQCSVAACGVSITAEDKRSTI